MLILVLHCLLVGGIGLGSDGRGDSVCPRLRLLGVVVGVLLLLLELELSVMFVHLTFSPTAVHHTSKMHCHRYMDDGSLQSLCNGEW